MRAPLLALGKVGVLRVLTVNAEMLSPAAVHALQRAVATPTREQVAQRTYRLMRVGLLDWQMAVNVLLIGADYHSDEFGRLGAADLNRIDDAFEAGTTPEQFAHEIITRDTVTT